MPCRAGIIACKAVNDYLGLSLAIAILSEQNLATYPVGALGLHLARTLKYGTPEPTVTGDGVWNVEDKVLHEFWRMDLLLTP